MAFKTILPTEIHENVFDQIKLGMPLLTAESDGKINTMTVNWGQMGYLWNRCVTTIYVRPSAIPCRFSKQPAATACALWGKNTLPR
ncbi:hypothetical protein [Hydrogenoanaerobacterium sp.]|uniref:hypothetical protein n=1 Tax=Hydrogenoanaerobacterium sp. TaxID=2953763 RepID=UPI0028970C90|nr:hypothetical protein [Hydrogenoanaerobacterium sp.]